MGNSVVQSRVRPVKRIVAGVLSGVLVAGMLVAGGIAAQKAFAAQPKISVSSNAVDAPLVAGEDGQIAVTFSNDEQPAAGEYNLSAMLVIPEGVTITEQGDLGVPTKTYISSDPALPGNYTATPAECEAMGLTATVGKCAVPEGMQLLVFENISDLPVAASNTATLTVRPNADVFEPGDSIPYVFTGFTSDNPNLLPVFPGGTSKAANASHASAPSSAANTIPVEALRVSKSEPSPEDELLRGAHDHQTVYTLNVAHTGEGDVTGAKIVDYLPAGLEYLGSGKIDNTETANGTAGAAEYPGRDSLIVGTSVDHWFEEESIVTVRFDTAEAEALGLPGAGVYTKVTWDLATLLAAGGSSIGTGELSTAGVAQGYPDSEGTAGVLTLQYVAAVPLFENTYSEGSFDEDVAGAHGALGQGSNLDNNTGPSTRHGDALDAAGANWLPNALTNTATASGDYKLKHPRDGEDTYHSSATGSHTVEAVDVRLVKTVDDAEFVQGGLATYTLTVSTSEYVTAELADEAGPSSQVRPNRLIDDLADGICPVFSSDVAVTPGASTQDGIPNLRIGDPNTGVSESGNSNLPVADWNDALGESLADCGYPSSNSSATLENATLTGISYDPATGHFFLDLWIDGMDANSTTAVKYTALQNEAYTQDEGQPGGTSSGDIVSNSAEVLMTTTPTTDTADVVNAGGIGVGGDFRAEENSNAQLRATESRLTKSVLPRSEGVPTAADITSTSLGWEEDLAPEPFAAGDEVWYRIALTLPTTTDVRNPKLSDFLPEGVVLPAGWPNSDGAGGFTDYVIEPPAGLPDYGTCETSGKADWLEEYAGDAGGVPTVEGNLLTWTLGSDDCVEGNNTDRFLPSGSSFTVFVKANVAGTSAAGTQDLPQNLAKYQQQARINEDGDREIFFLRDDAEIELVTTPQLVKGIEQNEFAGISGFETEGADAWKGAAAAGPNYPAGSNHDGGPTTNKGFWSDVDGEYAVQQDKITFRIDVQSPMGNLEGSVETQDYVVWDALPVGVKKADLSGFGNNHDFTAWATPVLNGVEGEAFEASDFTAQVYDFADYDVTNPPAGLEHLSDSIKTDKRSVIVWTLNPTIPGSQSGDEGAVNGFSLHYTVVVPSEANEERRDAILEQRYTNTASIVQYDAVTQTSTADSTTTLVPFGDDTLRDNGTDPAGLPDGAKSVPQDATFDDSNFMIPNAAMQKKLVSTEIPSAGIDQRNGVADIVQGEYATFDISTVIPANTTIRNGVLSDDGVFVRPSGNNISYKVESAELVAPTYGIDVEDVTETTPVADAEKFFFHTDSGTLVFPEYFQTEGDPVTFTVRLKVWVEDQDASHGSASGRTNITNNTALTNTARLTSVSEGGDANSELHDSASVTYREPNLNIQKTASPDANVAIGDEITYMLEVGNPGNRVASYDNVVVDKVPEGLIVNEDSFRIGGTNVYDDGDEIDAGSAANDEAQFAENSVTTGSGGDITWSFERTTALAQIPDSVFLFYTATIDETTGGGETYKNTAKVTGQTLPSTLDSTIPVPENDDARRGDRVSTAERNVTATTAAIDKVVQVTGDTNYANEAPIGQTVQYKVDVTLNANINYYDIEVHDALPAGVELQTDTVSVAMTTGTGDAVDVTEYWTRSGTDPNHTWVYNLSDGDLTSLGQVRTLTFTYDVLLKNTVAQNVNSLTNTAGLTWATTDGGDKRPPLTDPASVTVLNPLLSIVKDVKHADLADTTFEAGKTGEVDQKFTYRLNVTNASGANRSDAHNVQVTDKVPAGVVVDETTFKLNGAGITAPDTVSVAGDTVTWNFAGPIAPGAIASLTYDATFADSETLTSDALVNTARVTHYESFPSGGRSYDPTNVQDTANVTPVFPEVVPTKTVTAPVAGEDYGIGYVDPENLGLNWTLKVENVGVGTAHKVTVTDELPFGWIYLGGAAIGGVTLGAPTEGTTPEGAVTLSWSDSQIATAREMQTLASGDSFEITFNAKPTLDAIESPGAGTGVGVNAHTNTMTVTAEDGQGRENNPRYVPTPEDTADAFIAEADLLLEKAAIGGTTADIALSNDEILPQDSWIAGAIAGQLIDGTVDYTQPQWQLTVTNDGPDASFGQFEITEEQTLPEGVTVSDWQAHYYGADGSDPVELSVSVTGAGEDLTLAVGDAGTSLNPEGTDRIVITANVNIPAGTAATADELMNTATVEGQTFERDSNKPEGAENPNTDDAGKALTSVADLEIVKEFTGDTDELNSGDTVNWALTVTNNGPDHSLSTSGAGNQIVIIDNVPSEIVDAESLTVPAGWELTQDGNKFTFTLKPEAQLDTGASVTFTFTGRIGGAVAAGTEITNSATVTPGETPDPYTPNNDDEDTVGPKTAHTSVAATKQRVVLEDGAWVLAPGKVTAGETVSYRLQLTNTGEYVPASGVTLTDELESYLSMTEWVAETPGAGWELTTDGSRLTFTNGSAVIAPGDSASVILTATVAADYRDAVENTVCVTTGNLDPNQSTADDCATDSTAFNKSVDWELLKSHVAPAQDEPVVAGETVRYRLALNNNGPSVSDGPITIADVLPAGFSFAGNVVATGATLSDATVDGQTVKWTAEGPFAVGAGVVTVEFDAAVAANTAAGSYENTARVDGPEDEPDTNPTNNEDVDEVPVIRDAQMHIDKQVQSIDGAWGETAEHAAGTTVTWRVKITNDGSSAVPVSFTDDLTLAPGVTLTEIDGGSDWTYNADSQKLEYVANGGLHPVTLDDESNASWITITTMLDASVPPTEAPGLVNWGKIVWIDDTTNPDLADGGNSARDDANITTVRNADLGLIKQVRETAPEGEWIDADSADTAGSITAGESTSYRVLVSNDGPSDAVAPLTVTDTLPAGATFDGIIVEPSESGMTEWSASYDADAHAVTFTRNADFGGLAVGADPLAIEYGVSFDSALEAGSALENTAELGEETTTENGDQNPENNSNPANVVVERQIDLGIVKSHDADRVRIGDALPFTVDVTNYGPSEASGIVVTDEIPAGLEVLSEVGPVLDADGEETGWEILEVTLAGPGDDTVDPAVPAEPAAGATVTASYVDPLAPGESAAPLVIDTLVTASAYETVTNVVVVEGNEPEPDPDTENPNRAEDPVTVPPQVTLVVEKTATSEFKVGEVGTYKIAVSNHGPTLDPGPITVTDELPEGLSFNDAPELPAGVTVDHTRGVVTWTLTEPLGVGEEVVLTLNVNVHKSAYEQPNHEITNTVVIDSASELTPDSVLTDSVTVTVVQADPLVVTGGDLAAGLLTALALLLLLGGATYAAGRRRQGSAHVA